MWRFSAGHNQLFLQSEPTAIEGTTTRAELYFGNVQMMFMRPLYQGVHVGQMSEVERNATIEEFDLGPDLDGGFHLLAPGLLGFIVFSSPRMDGSRA